MNRGFHCLRSERNAMASPTVLHLSGRSRWKQWRRSMARQLRSPNSCCSKRILLLLVWQLLFYFSHALLVGAGFYIENAFYHFVGISKLVYALLAPFLGLIADVKVGRYEIIKLGTISSFIGSVNVFILCTVYWRCVCTEHCTLFSSTSSWWLW